MYQQHRVAASTMDIHREGFEKAKGFIEACARDGRPLTAGRNKKWEYSPVHLAAEAGVSVKTASSKAVRSLIASYGKALKASTVHRPAFGRSPRLTELMAYSIACREAENVVKRIPKDTGVDSLRTMFFEAARHRAENMQRDAATQLAELAMRAKLKKAMRDNIEYAQGCLRRVLADNGAPEDFPGRLAYAVKFSGWTYSALEREVGAYPGQINKWALNLHCPTEEQEELVWKCARLLKVEPEFLLSTIARGSAKHKAAFPPDLRTAENRDIRSEIRKHFPRNFSCLSLKAQQRIVEKLRPECEAKVLEERGKRAPRGPNYGFHHEHWPKKLRYQAEELRKHYMGGHEGWVRFDGTLSAKSWALRLVQAGLMFGLELSRNGGRKECLSFALFEDPDFVERFVNFRVARNTPPNGEPTISVFDAQEMDQWARLWDPEQGWIVQSAMMRAELGWKRRTAKAWKAHCADICLKYRRKAKTLRKLARPKLDRRRRAPIIVRVREPKTIAQIIVKALDKKWRSLPPDSFEADEALQDVLLCGIRSQAPFRDETMVLIKVMPGFLVGHLKRDARGWYLDVPKEIFKNRDGAAVEQGVYRRLRDQWGLYRHIEAFLSVGRARLLGDLKSPYLFAYGHRKGLAAMISNPKLTDKVKDSLYKRIKRATRDIAEELNLPGLHYLTATDFRDLVSLSVKKVSRNPDLTADAVNDGKKIADTVYAAERPVERVDWLYDMQAVGADAADSEARELLAEVRGSRRIGSTQSVSAS